MDLDRVFNEVAERMRSDLRRARGALTHPGQKGASAEETFRTFLREYLPSSLEVSSGILIDAAGNVSRQLDVIVFDAAKTPVLYRSGEDRAVPIECAYAVIEVKSKLNAQELERAFWNMRSVRSLKKTAYYKETGAVILHSVTLYGQEWEIWPTNFFVFAFNSTDPGKLMDRLEAMHQQHSLPEWERIDCVCVLDKGVMLNQDGSGMYNALPTPGSKLVFSHTNRPLLFFYTLVSQYFNQTTMPNFNFLPYTATLRF